MKPIFVFLFLILFNRALSQKGGAELMLGQQYLHYQHTIEQLFNPGATFGWQHIASFTNRYERNKRTKYKNEIMNQAYVTWKLTRNFYFKAGWFYNNAGGYKPSASVQIIGSRKKNTFLASARTDITETPAFEIFFLHEHFIPINLKTRIVLKAQAMSSATGRHHNRSYQLVRLGLEFNHLQTGVGFNLDEYGNEKTVHNNIGLFIKQKF